jgi:hypothetical protein
MLSFLWLIPIFVMMVIFGGLIVLTRFGSRAFYLHSLLDLQRLGTCKLSEYPRSITTAQRRSSSTATSLPPPRRFTRKKHDSRFRPTRNLPRLRAYGLSLLPHGDPTLAERESCSKNSCCAKSCAHLIPISIGRKSSCLRSTTRAARHPRSFRHCSTRRIILTTDGAGEWALRRARCQAPARADLTVAASSAATTNGRSTSCISRSST